MMPAVRCLLPVLFALSLGGCVRSQLPDTEDVDCRPGARVVEQNAAFCVYLQDRPLECPALLPYAHLVQGVPVCSGDDETPAPLLEAAVVQAVETQDDPGDAGQRPPVFSTADAAPRPTIIDVGGRDAATVVDEVMPLP